MYIIIAFLSSVSIYIIRKYLFSTKQTVYTQILSMNHKLNVINNKFNVLIQEETKIKNKLCKLVSKKILKIYNLHNTLDNISIGGIRYMFDMATNNDINMQNKIYSLIGEYIDVKKFKSKMYFCYIFNDNNEQYINIDSAVDETDEEDKTDEENKTDEEDNTDEEDKTDVENKTD